jgi:hypothetical protein
MTTPDKSHRPWFRFSLRSFFVLLTIFAIWLGVHVKWIKDRHEAMTWMKTHPSSAYVAVRLRQVNAPWSIRLFGEDGVETICVDLQTDEGRAKASELAHLFPEADVGSP